MKRPPEQGGLLFLRSIFLKKGKIVGQANPVIGHRKKKWYDHRGRARAKVGAATPAVATPWNSRTMIS